MPTCAVQLYFLRRLRRRARSLAGRPASQAPWATLARAGRCGMAGNTPGRSHGRFSSRTSRSASAAPCAPRTPTGDSAACRIRSGPRQRGPMSGRYGARCAATARGRSCPLLNLAEARKSGSATSEPTRTRIPKVEAQGSPVRLALDGPGPRGSPELPERHCTRCPGEPRPRGPPGLPLMWHCTRRRTGPARLRWRLVFATSLPLHSQWLRHRSALTRRRVSLARNPPPPKGKAA